MNKRNAKSSALSTYAAMACLGLVFVLFVGGIVVGVMSYLNHLQQKELAELGEAIANLDASYDEFRPPSLVPITAEKLTSAFAEDAEQAQLKYGGPRLVVKGTICDVERETTTVVLAGAITDDDEQWVVNAKMTSVSEDPRQEFEAVQSVLYIEGNSICIEGTVGEVVDNAVHLHEAFLVPDPNADWQQ